MNFLTTTETNSIKCKAIHSSVSGGREYVTVVWNQLNLTGNYVHIHLTCSNIRAVDKPGRRRFERSAEKMKQMLRPILRFHKYCDRRDKSARTVTLCEYFLTCVSHSKINNNYHKTQEDYRKTNAPTVAGEFHVIHAVRIFTISTSTNICT